MDFEKKGMFTPIVKIMCGLVDAPNAKRGTGYLRFRRFSAVLISMWEATLSDPKFPARIVRRLSFSIFPFKMQLSGEANKMEKTKCKFV